MRYLSCLLLALLVSAAAVAAPLPKVAVLEFNMTGEVVPDDQLETLNSAFRGVVVDAVGAGYDVMSKQMMLEMLPPGEVERCALLNECSVTIGKAVQSEYVVSGRLARIDGSLLLAIEAHETVRGRQLGSEQFMAQRFLELLASLKRDGPALLRKWLPVAEKAQPVVIAPPREPTPAVTTQRTPELKTACPGDMVAIPAGTFDMGSSEGDSDESPVHRVTLSAFCMARTETTQAEWRRVMGNDPSQFKGDKRPVEQVSWNDAIAYCNQRSSMEGLRPAYDSSGNRVAGANGYRLPTEAEWEYAARAGTTGDRYGELNDIAWCGDNSGSQTHDVGGKRPNAWGLHDMLGNVWEWTGDWYASYGSGAARDPSGPTGGSYRVYRGGSWFYDARYVRAPNRYSCVPGYRDLYLGFRPARSLP